MQVLKVRAVSGPAQAFPGLHVLGEFHLDDIGTPISELPRSRGPCAHARQIQDSKA
jgi:hypothetical protein